MLPSDILRRIAAGEVEGVRAADYGLPGAMKLNEAISSAWSRARDHWADFTAAREALGEHDETATVTTRQKWLQPLLEILGFGRLSPYKGHEIEGKAYPIQFLWQQVPLHLLGCRVPIDRRSKGVAGAATGSPHSLVQEFLNRSPEHLWAIVSNGLQWRLLRDNHTLSRQAYVEFDLEAMMQGEVYSDFALFWTLCHASCFEGGKPESCRLESWSRLAVTDGVKILGGLRDSVTKAIESLGQGFVGHPDNHDLRERLRDGRLSTQELYREVLRQIYRLLFLFVAEDRDLLHPPETTPEIRALYDRHYSTRRLREMVDRVRGTAHGDLWHALSLVLHRLGDPAGCPELGLPSLGSFLWDPASTAHLNAPSTPTPAGSSFPCHASIDNEHLLSAIRSLAYAEVNGVRRIVDYRNLGAEELGSVYESLLELVPTVVADTTAERSRFDLRTAAGNERKKSGSYYTPDSLVQCLLDSALEPVIADRVKSAKTPAERAEAVLSITVCDPAVGSGHFVIAAAHRLARHLARHRTGDSEPAPEDYRSALREVIRTSIYGIDINPMAAELCRVALWIESMEPGKPLSFLEHHIRVGNSLVGVTPELLAKGLPDDAFKAIEGDDNMFDFGAPPKSDLASRFSTLASGSDDTIAAVSRRRRQYEGLLASDDYRKAVLAADAWCAAFFWKKDGSKIGGIEGVTHELLREIEQHPERFPPGNVIRDEIDRLAAENQFLHLHLAYPEVAERGGFDCVLGNPPWERVKLQEKEWFAQRVPEIANAPNAAARGRMIKAIAREQPAMHAAFIEASRSAEAQSAFLRLSGRFPLCGRGDVNLYTVFAESMRDSLSPRGRAGMIVPSGIATDDTTKHFFQDLVERASLVSLFDFENAAPLFEGVHRSYKFACATLRAPAPDEAAAATAPPAEFVFFAHRVEDKVDAELTKYIYRRVPVLIDETKPDGNPWGVEFSAMFHMSNDSGLFRTREQLEKDGWELRGNVFERGEERYLPLYEAKMVHQFDHCWATYDGLETQDVALAQKETPTFAVLPRYWVDSSQVKDRLGDNHRQWFIAFRDVARSTDERTAIFCILPRVAVGHTAPLFFANAKPADSATLQAALSSYVFDYVTRQSVGGTHLTYGYVKQLSVLPPETYANSCPWDLSADNLRDWLLPRVLELTYTAWDLEGFARECGYSGPPFRWDEERRFLLRCELDAACFQLYGIARDDVDYILESFPIVRRKELATWGRYRSKETILEIYDALGEAQRTGAPYATRLDPPPAHARAAHGPAGPAPARA